MGYMPDLALSKLYFMSILYKHHSCLCVNTLGKADVYLIQISHLEPSKCIGMLAGNCEGIVIM